MRNLAILFGVIFILVVSVANAQDTGNETWKKNTDGTMEYNCQIFPNVINSGGQLSTFSDQIVARDQEGHELTLQEFVGSKVMIVLSQDTSSFVGFDSIFNDPKNTCSGTGAKNTETTHILQADSFVVIVNGNVNLRSCPSTDCDVVGSASNGSSLTVLGINGDWYQVQRDSGTAFIASRLTTRGPDAIIQVDEPYLDTKTGCLIVFDIKRGDMDINFILSGTNRSDVLADLYRPNEIHPLPVAAQLDKTFIDTNEPYIYQYYQWNVSWPLGTYQLELSLNGKTSKLAWELQTRGNYNIYVDCS